MKYEIMIKILFLLLSKGKLSARYIAQRFDISTRTVMRYLDAMSLANVPIIADSGRNGGFYIANSYKLPASFMTEKEFNAVIATLKGYNESVQNKTIESAITKLSAIKKKNKILPFETNGWTIMLSEISQTEKEKYQIMSLFVVQSLNHVHLFVTPWTAALQASLSFTISQTLLKLNALSP